MTHLWFPNRGILVLSLILFCSSSSESVSGADDRSEWQLLPANESGLALSDDPHPVSHNQDGSITFDDGVTAYPNGILEKNGIQFMIGPTGHTFWRQSRRPEGREKPPPAGRTLSGTGFFVSTDGYLVTNHHVVDRATRIIVYVGDSKLPAKVIRSDEANDLALLKVDGTFSPLPLNGDREIALGDTVFTVGFPNVAIQGRAPKFTKGEISSLSGLRDDPRLFQISVPLQPGNSGGPLVDSRGNVVGITTAQLNAIDFIKSGNAVPQNVNYAVKISYALSLVGTVPTLAEKLPRPNNQEAGASNIIAAVEKATALIVASE